MKKNNSWKVFVALLLIAASVWGYYKFIFTNFNTVVEKQFYRSRQLSKNKLKEVVTRYGIRTIINLRCDPQDKESNQVVAEELEVAAATQASFFCFELTSTKLPRKEVLKSLMETLQRAERPVLLHCYGGADRSGLASALALSIAEDASPEEMKKQYSWRYWVSPFGDTCGDLLFSKYEAWLLKNQKTHTGQNLTAWINRDYVDCDGSIIYNLDHVRYLQTGKPGNPTTGQQEPSLFGGSRTAKIKKQSSKLFIEGFAFDENGESLREKLSLVIDGKMVVDAVFGSPRPDVVRYYNLDKKKYAEIGLGWTAAVDTKNLSDGCHDISLRVTDNQGKGLEIPTQTRGCAVFRFCLQ